jgi:ATP/maltotriose-dependent transcriptional regulator MalT
VELLRARGRSDEALATLELGAATLHRGETFVTTSSGGRIYTQAERILRVLLLLDQADAAAARAELEVLIAAGDDDPPLVLAAAQALAWSRFHLFAEDISAAEAALLTAPMTGAVVAARVALALQRQAPDAALAIIKKWPNEDTLQDRLRRLLATAGVALVMDGRQEAADRIDEALVGAEPDGHVRVFLDAPFVVRAMTSTVLRRSPASSKWRQELAEQLDELKVLSGAGSVPVTPRELAVLEQLTTDRTHAQIASGLFVSENTLKSHCRNLYRKLGVNSRADAVRIARARGWLAASPRGDAVLDVNITPQPVVIEL